jgi:hypothetical protein
MSKMTTRDQDEKQINIIAAHMRAKNIAERLFDKVRTDARTVIDIYDRMPEDEEDEGDFVVFLSVAVDIVGSVFPPAPGHELRAGLVLSTFDRLDEFEDKENFARALKNAAETAREIFGYDPAPEIVLEVFDALNSEDDEE